MPPESQPIDPNDGGTMLKLIDRRSWMLGSLGSAMGALSGCSTPPVASVAQAAASVAAFSASPPNGRVPFGWSELSLRPGKTPTRYTAVRDGRRTVLHARASQGASALQASVDIDASSQSRLRWSWRVAQAPALASVSHADDDDAPVRLLIGFDGDHARLSVRDRLLFQQAELFTGHRPPFATLAYVWCGRTPPLTVVSNHRTGRLRYKVVESGMASVGRWQHYERNLVADYRLAFGGEPPGRVISVGVLTDSDATGSDFEAWYGDISIIA